MTDIVKYETGGLELSDSKEVVAVATSMAETLAGVIDKQRLFSRISGKRYVRCEGWTTLAALCGCHPCEVESTCDENGAYTSVVELRKGNGQIVGRASAICGGPEEPIWHKRQPFARKSMAATRATSKACRLTFSWIMALAGFEVTPAEEMEPQSNGEPASKPAPRPAPSKAESLPDKTVGLIQEIKESKTKKGSSRWGIKLDDGEWYGTFDEPIAAAATALHQQKVAVRITWVQSGKYRNVIKVEDAAEPLAEPDILF